MCDFTVHSPRVPLPQTLLPPSPNARTRTFHRVAKHVASSLCLSVDGVEEVGDEERGSKNGWDSSATIDGPRIYIPVFRYERGIGTASTRTRCDREALILTGRTA